MNNVDWIKVALGAAALALWAYVVIWLAFAIAYTN